MTRLAFQELQANRVQIHMDPRNIRSRNVAARLGFVYEGTLRCCAPGSDGQPTDRHVFALVREEFEALPWAKGG